MRPIARIVALLVVVAAVAGCGRFAGVADDIAKVRPPNVSGEKSAFEKVLDDAFHAFTGTDDEAQRIARSAGTDAVGAVASVETAARRYPGAEAKAGAMIRGTLCDLGRHYLTSKKNPDIIEMVRNNVIGELVPPLQLAAIAQDVDSLGKAYKDGVSRDRIYWSARIGLQCLLAGKSG